MTLTHTHSRIHMHPQVEMKDPLEASPGHICTRTRLKMEDLLQASLRSAQSLEARPLYLATPHALAENRDASN